MLTMYAALYLEINIIGVVLCLLVLFRLYRENDRQVANTAFQNTAAAILLILLLDAAWVLVDGQDTPVLVIANYVLNAWYLFQTGFITYLWMRYVICVFHKDRPLAKSTLALLTLPLAALFVLCVLSPWTGWLFSIADGNVYQRGPVNFLQQVVCYGYGLGTVLYSIHYGLRATNGDKRAEALTLSCFAVLPFLGGVVSILVFGLPTIWPLTVISLVMVYLNLQSQQISTDSLTGLNNRRQFDRYLRGQTDDRHREETLYLLLLDVDDFKHINDTFGHPIGDLALIETSQILKQVCGQRNAFLARYGGDEFAIVLDAVGTTALERLRADLDAAFEGFNQASGKAYALTISVGTAAFNEKQDTAAALVERADRMLYGEKAHKKLRPTAQ